jgi:hypothetical protein
MRPEAWPASSSERLTPRAVFPPGLARQLRGKFSGALFKVGVFQQGLFGCTFQGGGFEQVFHAMMF